MPEIEQQQRDVTTVRPSASSSSDSYPRSDWWGESGPDDVDEDARLSIEQIEKRGTPKPKWVAKTILRRNATVLCPHCLHDRDQAVAISEPTEHVPRTLVIERDGGKNVIVELAVVPKAHRWCGECGSVSFGGPLADRTVDEFREVLDEVLASASLTDFAPSTVEQARSDALASKGREDGPHDVAIMESFVSDLLEF